MNIAVLGLGKMGAPMAQRLLETGHEVTVWNRTSARTEPLTAAGARAAATPAEVWQSTEMALTMVYDDTALKDVCLGADGLVAAAPAGAVLIDMSTVSTGASLEVAAACEQQGVRFLRAPVSGGPAGAGKGGLAVLASGPRDAYDAAEPLLSDLGRPSYLGDAEQGRTVKLAINLIIAGVVELVAEAVVLGDSGGVDRETLMEAINTSAVGSQVIKMRTPVVVDRSYATPNFTVEGLLKDVGLITDVADEAGVTLPATTQISALLEDAIARGLGDLSYMALLPRLQLANDLPSDAEA